MRISALTVCVNYSDYLEQSLDLWRAGTDNLLVVTSPGNVLTQRLCAENQVSCYKTNVFYARGAVFNKAAAICEAIDSYADFYQDWRLFFDADIIPPEDWREIIEANNPQPGNLYGAPRELDDGRVLKEEELAGYFQLFHSSDPNVQCRPLLETNWRAANGYDSEFQARWAANQKIYLPMTVRHQGVPQENWWGRWNKEDLAKMFAERKRTGGIASMERLND